MRPSIVAKVKLNEKIGLVEAMIMMIKMIWGHQPEHKTQVGGS